MSLLGLTCHAHQHTSCSTFDIDRKIEQKLQAGRRQGGRGVSATTCHPFNGYGARDDPLLKMDITSRMRMESDVNNILTNKSETRDGYSAVLQWIVCLEKAPISSLLNETMHQKIFEFLPLPPLEEWLNIQSRTFPMDRRTNFKIITEQPSIIRN